MASHESGLQTPWSCLLIWLHSLLVHSKQLKPRWLATLQCASFTFQVNLISRNSVCVPALLRLIGSRPITAFHTQATKLTFLHCQTSLLAQWKTWVASHSVKCCCWLTLKLQHKLNKNLLLSLLLTNSHTCGLATLSPCAGGMEFG